MAQEAIDLQIEAIVFCANEPISVHEIQQGITEYFGQEIQTETLLDSIGRLESKYRSDEFSIEIQASGGGFQFLTKPAFQGIIGTVMKQKVKKRLSTSAMETLSIVAYRQPISKPELEKIRGVNCDYAVQKLLEKELIIIAGKSEQPGRPILYSTSKKFMDYFGINHLGELPQLKEILAEENAIGDSSE